MNQTLMLLIRLGLATATALVIAKPLELKIFEREIKEEIVQQNLEKEIEAERKLNQEFAGIVTVQQNNQEILAKLDAKDLKREAAYQAMIREVEGTAGTGIIGKGSVYQEKFAEHQKQEREYIELKQKSDRDLESNKHEISQLQAQKERKFQQIQSSLEQADGLAKKISVLHHLGEEDPTIARASWAVTLLFVAIDLTPIIAKLMSDHGPYDAILERKRKQIMIHQNLMIKEQKNQAEISLAIQAESRSKIKHLVTDKFDEAIKTAATSERWAGVLSEVVELMVQTLRKEILQCITEFRLSNDKLKETVKNIHDETISEVSKEGVKKNIKEEKIENFIHDALKKTQDFANGKNDFSN